VQGGDLTCHTEEPAKSPELRSVNAKNERPTSKTDRPPTVPQGARPERQSIKNPARNTRALCRRSGESAFLILRSNPSHLRNHQALYRINFNLGPKLIAPVSADVILGAARWCSREASPIHPVGGPAGSKKVIVIGPGPIRIIRVRRRAPVVRPPQTAAPAAPSCLLNFCGCRGAQNANLAANAHRMSRMR
jgi:hypothetical protein